MYVLIEIYLNVRFEYALTKAAPFILRVAGEEKVLCFLILGYVDATGILCVLCQFDTGLRIETHINHIKMGCRLLKRYTTFYARIFSHPLI